MLVHRNLDEKKTSTYCPPRLSSDRHNIQKSWAGNVELKTLDNDAFNTK